MLWSTAIGLASDDTGTSCVGGSNQGSNSPRDVNLLLLGCDKRGLRFIQGSKVSVSDPVFYSFLRRALARRRALASQTRPTGGQTSSALTPWSLAAETGVLSHPLTAQYSHVAGPVRTASHTITRGWASESSFDAGRPNRGGTGYGKVRARTYPKVPYRITRKSSYAEENCAVPMRLWLQ